jgi:hypothetical protein
MNKGPIIKTWNFRGANCNSPYQLRNETTPFQSTLFIFFSRLDQEEEKLPCAPSCVSITIVTNPESLLHIPESSLYKSRRKAQKEDERHT